MRFCVLGAEELLAPMARLVRDAVAGKRDIHQVAAEGP
jgi:hypothetical protein